MNWYAGVTRKCQWGQPNGQQPDSGSPRSGGIQPKSLGPELLPEPSPRSGSEGAPFPSQRSLTDPSFYFQGLRLITGLFARHPDRLANSLQDWATYSPGDQRFLSHALWLAGTKETRSFLRSVRARSGGREHDKSGSALDKPYYGIFFVSVDSVISTSGGS